MLPSVPFHQEANHTTDATTADWFPASVRFPQHRIQRDTVIFSPSLRTCAILAQVAASSNSSLLYILLTCFTITVLSTPNRSPFCTPNPSRRPPGGYHPHPPRCPPPELPPDPGVLSKHHSQHPEALFYLLLSRFVFTFATIK